MTPINQLLGAGQQVNSSAFSSSSPQSTQPMPPTQTSEGGMGGSGQPELERLAAIRDELLRMRAESPAMAPYIDAAIQSLVDGLSTTMQQQDPMQQPPQGMPNGQMQPYQGDSSTQPMSQNQLPY